MKPLREIQEAFAAAIFEGQQHPEKLQQFANSVHATEKLDAVGRIQVYAGSFQSNLSEALALTYPVCQKIVGENNFRFLAEKYILHYPSTHQNLNYYGDKMAELIATLPEIQKDLATIPYLADLAQLEWYYDQLLLAPDDENGALDFAALGAIPQERQGDIVFKLSRSAQLLQSPHNIFDRWLQHHPEFADIQPVGDARSGARSDDGLQFIFLSRVGFERQVEVVNADEFKFLQALQTTRRFSDICDLLTPQQVDVGALLPEAVRRGWIVNFELA